MSRYQTKEQRFWSKVNKAGPVLRDDLGPCWVWAGRKDRYGYGTLYTGPAGSVVGEGAHRLAFFFAHGRWPNPCALHRCDNPSCVRHDHLFEGTKGDNIRDCVLKGRHRTRSILGEANPLAKLTAVDVAYIRNSSTRATDLAERLGVTITTVCDARNRRTWRHVP